MSSSRSIRPCDWSHCCVIQVGVVKKYVGWISSVASCQCCQAAASRSLTYACCGVTQVGVVKKYADGDPVQELLNLVKLDLGISPETQFLQVSLKVLLSHAKV